jgi:outer membrane protein assembly factor BamA
MNKTALVTLWIDPAEHQIVKYTFDNVWLDFLPGAWLVRVDDIRASMTMGQPFPGVWLPRGMNIHAGVTLANGSFEAGYARAFDQYREAQVKTTIRVPKLSARVSTPQLRNAQLPNDRMGGATGAQSTDTPSGPYVDEAQAAGQQEIVREVRVHGNASLTDDEVLKFAGIELNAPLPADGVAAIEQRLKASRRFETIEVRKRFRSLDDPTDVALVLVVHERPGVKSGATDTPAVFRPVSRLKSQLMFLPILTYADGYGFTYGARLSTVDYLGFNERLSVPLTWGGTRRAAIEFDRGFKTGPISRVTSSFGIWNRENPRYEIREQRVELTGRVERDFAHVVRVGFDAAKSTVSFGDLEDDVWTMGANAALDTRSNPIFPGNAVYLGAGWTALNVKGQPRVNRYATDARGYLRLFGQTVLAGRAQYLTADAPLPLYERTLVGGASNLRGFDTGAFDGDKMLGTSAELRAPITSVIHGAKFGLSAFVDAVRVADYGSSLKDAEWRRGVGGGVFIVVPLVTVHMGVGHGLDGGGTHFFLSSGFSF